MIKSYLVNLLGGGRPILPPATDSPSSQELAALTELGGAFAWLADEPDLYSLDDGEPA